MKKILLGIFITAGFSAAAQTFTVDDTLSAGDAMSYFVVDSNAVDLASTTGAGVSWDYSSISGYANVATNLDTVINATDSPDAADFPSSDYNDVMNGGTSIFFSNYADSVIAHGYVFDVDGNTVILKHNIDPMKMLELPMSLGSTYSDSIYGVANAPGIGINNSPTAGEAIVTADGTGTLNIGTTSITNVIRIKLVETIEATITIPVIGTATGYVTRTVYSYYDLANQNEAVFIHATIDVTSTAFNGGYSAVYSSVEPTSSSSTVELSSEQFEFYPNPARELIQISTPENTDELNILNAIGQNVLTVNKPATTVKLNIESFDTGVYFVQITRGESTLTKKLIVK